MAVAATAPAPKPASKPAEGWPSKPPPTVPAMVPKATRDPPARMFVSAMGVPYPLKAAAASDLVNGPLTLRVRLIATASG